MFDTLCRAAERSIPSLRRHVDAARIFRIDDVGDEATTQDRAARAAEAWADSVRIAENIHLPFDSIAMEHAGQRETSGQLCQMLSNTGEPGVFQFAIAIAHKADGDVTISQGTARFFPRGWSESVVGTPPFAVQTCFSFVDLISIRSWRSGRRGFTPCSERAPADVTAYTAGRADEKDHATAEVESADEWGGSLKARVEAGTITRAEIQGQLDRAHKRVVELQSQIDIGQDAIGYISLVKAAADLLWITAPSKFVLQETPLVGLPDPKPGIIKRSPWRPHYIVLDPAEIRRRLMLPNPCREPGSTVAPHERRGHWRTFHSERFKNVRGQKRWIEAMWIGPSEAIIGKNKYSVRLDL